MIRFFSLLPGLALLSLTSFLLVWLLTQPSRDELTMAIQRATRLADHEAALLQRMFVAPVQSSAMAMPENLIWPGADRSEVGLAMQNRLLEFSGQAGLKPLSFGLSATVVDTSHSTVTFDIELEGGYAEMSEFLRLTQNARPPLAISYLWIRQLPVDPSQPIVPIAMRLTVWGFGGKEATP